MCQNAEATAVSVMTTIEPMLVNLGTQAKILDTPEFQTFLAEYKTALTAIEGWKKGDVGQTVVEAIQTLEAGLTAASTTIPALAEYSGLINVILAVVATVIGVIDANSAAPTAPVAATATLSETQEHHQVEVAAATVAKVAVLVPGFKRSIFHSPAYQAKKAWNDAVTASGMPESMHVA